MDDSSDTDLVEAVLRGSARAADVLFTRHWPRVWAAAYAVLGERSTADDAAQRAVERAIRGLHTFRTDASFPAWIRRIAVNQAIDDVRRAPREAPLPESLPGRDVYADIVERDALAGYVARLPDDRRISRRDALLARHDPGGDRRRPRGTRRHRLVATLPRAHRPAAATGGPRDR